MAVPPMPGPLALVGSGEFLPVMDETDLALLARIGGPTAARVVVLPTASGLEEPSSPERWMSLGLDHFKRLGAQADAVEILTREDAHDRRWLSTLAGANFFYFSGGSPQHLIETLAGSPAWKTIRARHQDGAVLAGCSAGAMALGGLTSGPHALRSNPEVTWLPALGLLPGLIVLPHFDRLIHYIGEQALRRAIAAVPSGMVLAGIDEETALLRLDDPHAEDGRTTWQVSGRQSVSLYTAAGDKPAIYKAGQIVPLDLGQPESEEA